MPLDLQKAGLAAVGSAASLAAWKIVDDRYAVSKDLHNMVGAYKAFKKPFRLGKQPNGNVVTSWYETLACPGAPDHVMFIQAETGRRVIYQEVEELSNRISHWSVSQSFQPGSCVSLIMDNRPEYVVVWLGMLKAGINSAFINTNLKGKPLIHVVTITDPVAVVLGTEHVLAVEACINELRAHPGLRIFASYGAGGMVGFEKPSFCDVSLDESLISMDWTPVNEARRKHFHISDAAIYIYTSGTTGLPKACKVAHMRLMLTSGVFTMGNMKQWGIAYGSGLPLYHTAACLGVNWTMHVGGTLVIRTKFSTSKHWEDCAKYRCEAMQYIGELCRYLLAQPDDVWGRKHQLRLGLGNGLRPEIWDQFQRRFNIPEILEFYGATEGAGALINFCQKYEAQGAVGHMGALFRKITPTVIVKFDVEKEVPIRDPKTGFCIVCAPNETGELLNQVKSLIKTSSGEEVKNFDGYTNDAATDKKIMKDVFQKGDTWYRSGDLLRMDAKGYFYFVDRIGDTFRWKGENVSTMEVSEIVSAYPGVVDANVYGVEVPGKDGRACMVAITLDENTHIDPAHFATYCLGNLPSYAVPVFVRFLEDNINLTGTFKHQKGDYRNQGCDPTKISDKLWWLNAQSGIYDPYGKEEYLQITAGQSKL